MNAADEAVLAELWEACVVRGSRARVFLHGGEELLGRVTGACWRRNAQGAPMLVIRTADGVRIVRGEEIACYRILKGRKQDG